MRGLLALTLVVAAACLGPAAAQLGYLPPRPSDHNTVCKPLTQYSTQLNVQTINVGQPITIDQTQTAFAQALVTAVQAITTTYAQTETRRVVVPVIQTFEQVAQAVQTQVSIAQVPGQNVVSSVIETKIISQTQTNEVVETSITNVVQPVAVTSTQFTTAFSTSIEIETKQDQVQETKVVTEPDVTSAVVQTEQALRTELVTIPASTSVVQSVVVKTSDVVSFITLPVEAITSVVQNTVFNTQTEAVVQTQQAFTTVENINTEVITSTAVSNVVVTSTAFSQENVVVTQTQTVDRVVTSNQAVEQVVTTTRYVDDVNQVVVTNTQYVTVPNVITVPGSAVVQTQVITSVQGATQVITQTENVTAGGQTEVATVTAPCTQTMGGYNYNRPAGTSFNFAGY